MEDFRGSLRGFSGKWLGMEASRLSLELSFLVTCVRAALKREECLDVLSNRSERGFDWGVFSKLTRIHRVASLAVKGLKKFSDGWESVPEDVRESLQSDVEWNTQRALENTVELVRLTKSLEAVGVSAMTLKGPCLAMQAYGDIALRNAGDIDLLVPLEDIEKADKVLKENGYRIGDTGFEMTEAQKIHYRKFRNHHRYFDEGRSKAIEVHWRLHSVPLLLPLGFEELWQRAERVKVAGHPAAVMSARDMELHLCTHGATHVWLRLQWIADIALIFGKKNEDDWVITLENAREAGVLRAVLQGAALSCLLLGEELPTPVRKAFENERAAGGLTRYAFGRIREHYVRDVTSTSETLAHIRYELKLRPELRYKAEILRQAVMCLSDWGSAPLCLAGFFRFITFCGLFCG